MIPFLARLRRKRRIKPNLLASPNDFTTTTWTKTNATVTAAKLAETATTAAVPHNIRQAVAKPTVIATYTLTVDAQAVERGAITLAASESNAGAWVSINITARTNARAPGSFGGMVALSWSAEPSTINAGYTTCKFTFTTTALATISPVIEIYNAADSYPGVAGSGINIRNAVLTRS